jgi:hypothetical protein
VRRLRAALVVVVIAALAAAMWSVASNSVRQADKPSVNAHRAELVAQARLAAADFTSWLTRSHAELAQAAAALAQAGVTRPALDRALPAGSNLDGGLVVLDERGFVVATTSELTPLDHQTRSPASDVVDDPLEGENDRLGESIALTSPLPNARILVGYTRVPSGTLSELVSATTSALGHPLYLVTGGGTIVPASTDTTPGIRRVDAGLAPAVAAATTGPTHITYKGEAGESTVAAVAPVGDGWVVVAPRPASELAVTGDRATNAAAAAIALVLALAFVVIVALLAVLRARSQHVEEAKQAFLAIAGHELRTPLTVMKGFTDLLVDSWDDVPDESRRGIVETINYQVRNLEHLVERLLLGAQLEAGVSPSTSRETVELAPIVEAVAQHQRAIAPHHAFVVHAAEGLRVSADAGALTHVITNLVENAVKYSPDGAR